MQQLARKLRGQGRLGFVPTMGALHEGHLSLVRLCRRLADRVVVSVFVNPTQFAPGEDLARYPRQFRRDCQLLAEVGVDAVFYPTVRAMYRDNHSTWVQVERLTKELCGRFRPDHFRGVATVVTKLFNIVGPDVAVFGQKDAQQAAVIRRMTRDLSFPVRIVVAPTVREPDGLAMSSRNAYLSPKERRQAPVLYRSLQLARQMIETGVRDPNRVRRKVRHFVRHNSDARIQYVQIVDPDEISPVRLIHGKVLVAIAAFFGRTRLIDNIVCHSRQ